MDVQEMRKFGFVPVPALVSCLPSLPRPDPRTNPRLPAPHHHHTHKESQIPVFTVTMLPSLESVSKTHLEEKARRALRRRTTRISLDVNMCVSQTLSHPWLRWSCSELHKPIRVCLRHLICGSSVSGHRGCCSLSRRFLCT